MNFEMGNENGTKLARVIVGPHFKSPMNVSSVFTVAWEDETDSILTVLKV